MSVCRTCLSKNDLLPIFSDKNRVVTRTKQLYEVTGIKVNNTILIIKVQTHV